MDKKVKTAIIIGAGPAGLTAALELLRHSDIKPVIFEASSDNGGISKTINHHGNRIDIGGHRFFSKSDRVMSWWLDILPLQRTSAARSRLDISYHHSRRSAEMQEDGPDPDMVDDVMLVRNRVSRIFYLGKFFNYPLSLDLATLKNLGLRRVIRIGISYIKARLFPIRNERTLEQFFINRFGRELYATFFRDYTEKVWGTPCREISAEWGAQRIKGLSISTALVHAIKRIFRRDRSLSQKGTETSLIEYFLYPKYGPGHMWDTVARKIRELGGEIHYTMNVIGLHGDGNRLTSATVMDARSGATHRHDGDYFFSTMPIKDLVNCLDIGVPEDVRRIANGLVYRDFITVGLLLDRLSIANGTARDAYAGLVPDNWIYMQEPDVKIGRLQIFNNWSPYMVKDRDKIWIGLEYFCNEGDELWNTDDAEFVEFAKGELDKLGIIRKQDVLDSILVRMPKTYPAYFGTYHELPRLREFLDPVENLFLIGRNGMHKYNNQDHSMLTAMMAVENIVGGMHRKDNIWAVNTETEYHEEK